MDLATELFGDDDSLTLLDTTGNVFEHNQIAHSHPSEENSAFDLEELFGESDNDIQTPQSSYSHHTPSILDTLNSTPSDQNRKRPRVKNKTNYISSTVEIHEAYFRYTQNVGKLRRMEWAYLTQLAGNHRQIPQIVDPQSLYTLVTNSYPHLEGGHPFISILFDPEPNKIITTSFFELYNFVLRVRKLAIEYLNVYRTANNMPEYTFSHGHDLQFSGDKLFDEVMRLKNDNDSMFWEVDIPNLLPHTSN